MTTNGVTGRPTEALVGRPAALGFPLGCAANLGILAVLGYAAFLHSTWPDFHYRSVQEDEYVEWATAWAFLLSALTFAWTARAEHQGGTRPWFVAGLALFCLVVAMEEISWGQRLFAYGAPTYFLESNAQQEVNVHNLVAAGYRKLALSLVIGGYGVALPLFARLAWLRRFGIEAPPIELVPAFALTLATYRIYPWSHTGEWVELMLGLSFLFSAIAAATAPRDGDAARKPGRGLRRGSVFAVGWALVLALGVASAEATGARRGSERVAVALAELAALRRDFVDRRLPTVCDLHERLYTYATKYRQDELFEGAFATLAKQPSANTRAKFLLDPWGTPYWLRDQCEGDRRRVQLYSFGPNRRRDSTAWELGGDDLEVILRESDAVVQACSGVGCGRGDSRVVMAQAAVPNGVGHDGDAAHYCRSGGGCGWPAWVGGHPETH